MPPPAYAPASGKVESTTLQNAETPPEGQSQTQSQTQSQFLPQQRPVIASSTYRRIGKVLVYFRFRNRPRADYILEFDPKSTIKEAVEVAMENYPDNCDFNVEAVYACNDIGEKYDVSGNIRAFSVSQAMVITDNSRYWFWRRMVLYVITGLLACAILTGAFFLLKWIFFLIF